jgi:acyl carrier protein
LEIDAEKVGDNAHFNDDLGGDSVQAAEWVAAIEAEFDVDIDPDVANEFRTIGDVVSFLEKEQG